MEYKNSVTKRMFDYLTYDNTISNYKLSLQATPMWKPQILDYKKCT
jgi:hypothetical protein